MPSPTLTSLAPAVSGTIHGDGSVVVDDVQHDSRRVLPGTLFVAVRGERTDGHRFVAPAVAAGAAAVCLEEDAAIGVPRLIVGNTRRALAPLAAAVHGNPSRRLTLAGITGTNGKTTVVHFLESIAHAAGRVPGIVGTLGARIGGRSLAIGHTTPEASDFQRLLAEMVAAGVGLAAVEVSSHALSLGRADCTWFQVAAFTNLSRDHLDFHRDMESYYRAKASLFTPDRAGEAVIWIDDPMGERLAAETEVPVVRVGADRGEVHAGAVDATVTGTTFELVTPRGTVAVAIRLPGAFNVANALVAAACALQMGIGLEAIAAGLGRLERVPGRMEPVAAERGPAVLVDYAHTPASVAAAVAAARGFGAGRLVAVVGAGGDRDRDKRPEMGRAAAGADVVVVTSDNPRSEPPEQILAAVAAGAREVDPDRVIVEGDRRKAIRAALTAAGEGGTVLVLGKGHEQGQDFGDRVEPFDDVTVAREELAAR